jgi:hypothetical protein
MQLGSGISRGQAAAENNRRHFEITPIFLDEKIGCGVEISGCA